MLSIITFIISSLVILNLLLLKFSCNKTVKRNKTDKKPVVMRPKTTIPQITKILAPTGS